MHLNERKFASLFALFVLAVLLYSYRAVTKPYIGAKVFTLRSIVVSCIIILLLEFFINTGGTYYAFSSLMIYHLLMSRLFSASTGFSYLLYPYFFKGIGYLIIYAGIGKYLMADTTFETFPQGWFVVALVRNAVGSSVISHYISEWHEYKTMVLWKNWLLTCK